MININKTQDPFYRYKMQAVKLVSQKNNFYFSNIHNIIENLNTTLESLIKFIKSDIGIHITIDKKTKQVLVPKTVLQVTIQESIYKYIKKYVLCEKCCLPEVSKHCDDYKCNSCGMIQKDVKYVNESKLFNTKEDF